MHKLSFLVNQSESLILKTPLDNEKGGSRRGRKETSYLILFFDFLFSFEAIGNICVNEFEHSVQRRYTFLSVIKLYILFILSV